ncbi:ring finger protein 126 [Arthroderma uncinatum]|uniref:ring finger protein 126 n=1 Tax=Arthroderma uncinatum TaxID=74035 RepID=UPI00144AAC29|nr:ring finger protein 126 [Arthroderma uncinatum]KAF3482824.1 ring finger protein 126 [Arthroderma uncinatum]
MAERVTGDQVFCHECEHQWPRSEHGLTCPYCQSEFVEILEEDNEQSEDTHSEPRLQQQQQQQQQQQPYNPGPTMFSGFNNFLPNHQTFHENNANGHVTRHHYHSNDGRFQFTSTTIRSPRSGGGIRLAMNGNAGHPGAAEDPLVPIFRNFNAILQGIAETQPNRGGIPPGYGYQNQNQPRNNNYRDTDPPEILGGGLWPQDANHPQGNNPQPLHNFNDILGFLQGAPPPAYNGGGFVLGNPLAVIAQALGMHRHGDAVYSQEELDRVISELVDQNMNGGAPAPASDDAIRALPKKKVDKAMLGSEGKAECSISAFQRGCMSMIHAHIVDRE